MGSAFSHIKLEMKKWEDHTLHYDSHIRESNLKLLSNFKDGEPIYLSSTPSSFGGITYHHWFITDKTFYFEFGGANTNIYEACVGISSNLKYKYSIEKSDFMNEEIRDRMKQVLGVNNYSLALRNCEHIANYAYRGRWISAQMTGNGILMKIFQASLGGNRRKVNTFPASIIPHVFGSNTPKIYSFPKEINDKIPIATGLDYYMDYEEDTHNVLFIGPTGAGKSHLINVLFNRKICESEPGHLSVTKDIYFVRGRTEVHNTKTGKYEFKKIVVVDTVGLCDAEWNDTQVFNMIKGRVSSNMKFIDAVYIVYEAKRLKKDDVKNIRKVLKWLGYSESTSNRYLFVATNAEHLTNQEKERMHKEAINLFKSDGIESWNWMENQKFIYTGFPPPKENLKVEANSDIIEGWKVINKELTSPPDTNRIDAKSSLCRFL